MIKISKNGRRSWVTFTASFPNCASCYIKGSWNEWKPEKMKKKRNGDFYLTKVLKTGESYQFGYMPNNMGWETEEECKRVPTPYGSENSLLEI